MNWPEMFRAAEALVRTVAPELRAQPLYLIALDEIDLPGDCAFAFTGPRTCYECRPLISDWRGPGPCIPINRLLLERWAGRRELFIDLAAVVVHELGHIGGWFHVAQDAGWPEMEYTATRAAAVAQVQEFVQMPTESVNFDWHPPRRFGRLLCHLAHRAEKVLGRPLPVGRCIWKAYRPPGLFHLALGNEPERFANRTMFQILQEQPPAAFERLAREHDECLNKFRPSLERNPS